LFQGPAIALLELESIARGFVVADAVVKKAPVRLLMTEPVSPGKFLLLFDGEVADVEESWAEAREIAGATVVDKLYLPNASLQLAPAIRGELPEAAVESLGIVETQTVAAALLAADTALKAAEVRLTRMQLARGIGGKGFFVMTGELDMVEAAVAAAAAALEPTLLLTTELIARPHPDLVPRAR